MERLELQAGVQPWELDLALGSIEGFVPLDGSDDVAPRRAKWLAPRPNLSAVRTLEVAPDGSFQLGRIPAGTVAIEVMDSSGDSPTWRELGTVEVPAGAGATVDLR